MDAKRYDEACSKFAETYRLSSGTGALLNLASCEEARLRWATALAHYKTAVIAARRENRNDRASFAESRIKAIEPGVSEITITLTPGAEVDGLEVRLDNFLLSEAAYGVATPLDPGTHFVTASAPGYRRVVQQIEIGQQPEKRTLMIPVLQPEDGATTEEPQPTPAAAPTVVMSPQSPAALSPNPPANVQSTTTTSPQYDRAVGGDILTTPVWIAGGITVAAAAGAVFTGVQYSAKKDDFDAANEALARDRTELRNEAQAYGWISLGLTGVAVVGAGITTVLIVSNAGGSSAAEAPRIIPWVAQRSGGLVLRGSL